jgi:hypothetical protein
MEKAGTKGLAGLVGGRKIIAQIASWKRFLGVNEIERFLFRVL